MGKINWSRVITGGLLAGLVVNIVEGVVGSIFMDETTAHLEAHGLSMDFGAGMMALYLLMGFLFGIAAVWFYAAIRPRFNPGPKTAVIAATALWIVGYLFPIIGYASIGLYPAGMMITWIVVGLVEINVATLLGAWIYKEGESAAAA